MKAEGNKIAVAGTSWEKRRRIWERGYVRGRGED